MLQCCLCQSLDASPGGHDESRLELLLDHAGIHNSQINRNAKANILKIFANCFPNIAAKYTIREVVDSMEAPQNSGSNDGTDTKAVSVPPKRKEKMPQSQDTTLVKNMEKRSPIDKQGKPSSWQPPKISVHVQCRKILEASCDKRQQRFQCGVCSDLVALQNGRKDRFYSWNAIGHVLQCHMDIKPFRCRYCDYTAKSRFSMSCHVKRAHQTPDYSSIHFINEVDAHQKEICEMVTTCFGKKQGKAIKNESKKGTKITKQYGDTTLAADNGNQSATYDGKKDRPGGPSVIGAHCRQTLAPYSTEQRRFECGICGTFITLRRGPNGLVSSSLLLQHAVAHMRIEAFRCRYCTFATKFQSYMCYHVKYAHKLAASSTHYTNELSVHEKEICEMITMCFGKKD